MWLQSTELTKFLWSANNPQFPTWLWVISSFSLLCSKNKTQKSPPTAPSIAFALFIMKLLKSIMVSISFLSLLVMAIKADTISTSENQVGGTSIKATVAHLEHDCHNATSRIYLQNSSSLDSKDGVWSCAVWCVEESMGLPQPSLGPSNWSKVSLSDGSHYKIPGPIRTIKCLVTRKCQLLFLSSLLLRVIYSLLLSFSTTL